MTTASPPAPAIDLRQVIIWGNELQYFRQRHPQVQSETILRAILAYGPCRESIDAELRKAAR
jgi:hypothetical protein